MHGGESSKPSTRRAPPRLRRSFDRAGVAQTFRGLHSFWGDDGDALYSGVVLDGQGRMFGSTLYGGAGSDVFGTAQRLGTGAIYRQDPDASFRLLHTFSPLVGNLDGMYPTDNLLVDGGVVWGTTAYGGANGVGVVFSLQPDGQGFTVVHAFDSVGGCSPDGGLVSDHGGQLYGTATACGGGLAGVIYRIDVATGAYTVIHTFAGKDGAYPTGTLARAASGKLYGVTHGNSGFYEGVGIGGRGTVFQLDPATGVLVTLHTFNLSDGSNPRRGPVFGPDGALYGVTQFGGAADMGVVYRQTL